MFDLRFKQIGIFIAKEVIISAVFLSPNQYKLLRALWNCSGGLGINGIAGEMDWDENYGEDNASVLVSDVNRKLSAAEIPARIISVFSKSQRYWKLVIWEDFDKIDFKAVSSQSEAEEPILVLKQRGWFGTIVAVVWGLNIGLLIRRSSVRVREGAVSGRKS